MNLNGNPEFCQQCGIFLTNKIGLFTPRLYHPYTPRLPGIALCPVGDHFSMSMTT